MKIMAKSRTLYDKIWDNHLIQSENDTSLIYIDRHLVHEVTSPVAFLGLKNRGIKVLYPERTFATADHNLQIRERVRTV